MLLDREHECRRIDDLVRVSAEGHGQSLLLVGAPGIGKSALLEHARGRARGWTVASVTGVQTEMEIAYAGLEPVLRLLDPTPPLPPAQQEVVDGLLGRQRVRPWSRYLIGLTLVTTLAQAARTRPVLLVVDDVQWVDRSTVEAVAFAARRLEHDRVAVVLAGRPGPAVNRLVSALPHLTPSPLSQRAATALLRSHLTLSVDEMVLTRLAVECRGNPLVLSEAARMMRQGFSAPSVAAEDGSMTGWLERGYRTRLWRLPARTRTLLLLAAAEPTGDPQLLWRAASSLQLAADDADPAVADGLVDLGTLVTFAHPLVRSAVYESAAPVERRRAHLALAHATPRGQDRDRRAWHLAAAAVAPDDDVAAELERCAEAARTRGGLFASAAFLRRATELTGDPAARARRALDAAQAMELAGDQVEAQRLLVVAESGPLTPVDRARAAHVHGRVAMVTNRGPQAAQLVLEAARAMEQVQPREATEIYLEAVSAALFASGYPTADATQAGARDALGHLGPCDERALARLLHGLARATLPDGLDGARASLTDAVRSFLAEDLDPGVSLRWSWLACRAAALTWDEEAWGRLVVQGVGAARLAGSFIALPAVLNSAAGLHAFRGDVRAALSAAQEADAVWRTLGMQPAPYGRVVALAVGGSSQDVRSLAALQRPLEERGEGMGVALVRWALALRANASGRFADATAHAEAASTHPASILYSVWALPELIEAAARNGDLGRARRARHALEVQMGGADTSWAHGVRTRCLALTTDGPDAEALYRESVEALTTSTMALDRARSRLLLGEWLRRDRRPAAARTVLTTALQELRDLGAVAFTERAQAEARAAGARPTRERRVTPGATLSPQEDRIARLASDGLTNADIAARLYLSPSTVDYHLRKVFEKLGIGSRTRLHAVLPHDESALRPTT